MLEINKNIEGNNQDLTAEQPQQVDETANNQTLNNQTANNQTADNQTVNDVPNNQKIVVERVGAYIKSDFGYENANEYNKKVEAYQSFLNEENAKQQSNNMRMPLIFSALSMILAFFGIGLPFAVVGLILSCQRLKVKKSRQLRWAYNLSIIGLFMNLAIIICIFLTLIFAIIQY